MDKSRSNDYYLDIYDKIGDKTLKKIPLMNLKAMAPIENKQIVLQYYTQSKLWGQYVKEEKYAS